MEKPQIERKYNVFTIKNTEQLKAFNDPVHDRIFAEMDHRGPITKESLCQTMKLNAEELDGYLNGLVSIGLVEAIDYNDKQYYQPVARYFSVEKELLISAEGLMAFQEGAVKRFAEMAQKAASMGEEIYDECGIGFFRFSLNLEQFKEVRKKIFDLQKEISDQYGKAGEKDEESKLYQLAYFIYPIT